MKKKTNYKVILNILISSIILGIIYNYFSSDGIDFVRKPISIVTANESNDSDTNAIIGIDLAQAVNFYNTEAVIFIDARDQWDYNEKHITGAINIPEFSFSSNDTSLSGYTKHQIFVIYCNGGDCDISKRLAKEFKLIGFINTFVFLGGINEWQNSGLPITKGLKDE